MLFEVSHGDIAEISRKSDIPHETVRRYINGGDVRVSAARKIDAAAAELGLKRSENAEEKQKENRKSAPASAQGSENAEEMQSPSRDTKAAAKAGMGA